jgi:hypothetical protein
MRLRRLRGSSWKEVGGTDIPGALQIALAGKLESSNGRCGNGVYHVGAPANLTELQAIEHLWEETHTTGANGGALVLSTMEGVLVVQRWSEENGQRDLRPWYRHTFSSRRLCGKRALALMETCVVVVCLLLIVHSPLLFCRFLITVFELFPAAVCIYTITSFSVFC